jgi:hypothetical protein
LRVGTVEIAITALARYKPGILRIDGLACNAAAAAEAHA